MRCGAEWSVQGSFGLRRVQQQRVMQRVFVLAERAGECRDVRVQPEQSLQQRYRVLLGVHVRCCAERSVQVRRRVRCWADVHRCYIKRSRELCGVWQERGLLAEQ